MSKGLVTALEAELNDAIQQRAREIQLQLDRGELVATGCAMAALPTVSNEIWYAAEELAQCFEKLPPITVHQLMLADSQSTSPEQPFIAVESADIFDHIHHALTLSVKC
ncbi:hypothetical protein [Pontibacterium sp.]|uniref:hypothetical protein n=1 Tax=Pontibacterium sp. TaxID=2036026 RepID=UPI003514D678